MTTWEEPFDWYDVIVRNRVLTSYVNGTPMRFPDRRVDVLVVDINVVAQAADLYVSAIVKKA